MRKYYSKPAARRTSLCSASYARVNVTLLAFAAERRAAAPPLLSTWRPPLSIDISSPRGAQQQTRRTSRGMMGQTDGRTLDRFIDPAPHTMRAVSIHRVTVT